MLRILPLLVFALSFFQLSSQNTVGLISYDVSKSWDGYNLMFPHNQSSVFLLNNCGEVVHSWTDTADVVPGNTAYLKDDGRLVKGLRPRSIAGDFIWAGGGGATIEIRDWDNNLEWSYTLNDSTARLHHDFEVLDNDNLLLMAWEAVTVEQAVARGRDTIDAALEYMWPEWIFEINPETDEIVWEWHQWDHLVQDFDENLPNFGVIAEHSERFNINYDDDANPDWHHANSIDYDEVNNFILVSSPYWDEIWVVDHTTTTQQAKGSIGGMSNRGGDLMWRWGNNLTFDVGSAEEQQLFFSHDANLINDPWLDEFDPFYNDIAIFSNRAGADYSLAHVIDNTFDMYEWSFPFDEGRFGPNSHRETIAHPDSQMMYSTGLSSVQYLPNGNFMICVGRFGYTFEITPNNEIVWEYKTPLRAGQAVEQGDSLEINNNLTFRMKRYPTDYSAFDGRDLSPKGWIETNPDSNFCSELTAIANIPRDYGLSLTPNPADDMVSVSWTAGVYADIEVVNSSGITVFPSTEFSGGRRYIDTSGWLNGVYFVRINQSQVRKLVISR